MEDFEKWWKANSKKDTTPKQAAIAAWNFSASRFRYYATNGSYYYQEPFPEGEEE